MWHGLRFPQLGFRSDLCSMTKPFLNKCWTLQCTDLTVSATFLFTCSDLYYKHKLLCVNSATQFRFGPLCCLLILHFTPHYPHISVFLYDVTPLCPPPLFFPSLMLTVSQSKHVNNSLFLLSLQPVFSVSIISLSPLSLSLVTVDNSVKHCFQCCGDAQAADSQTQLL